MAQSFIDQLVELRAHENHTRELGKDARHTEYQQAQLRLALKRDFSPNVADQFIKNIDDDHFVVAMTYHDEEYTLEYHRETDGWLVTRTRTRVAALVIPQGGEYDDLYLDNALLRTIVEEF